MNSRATSPSPTLRAALAALTLTLGLAAAGCEDEKAKTSPADAGAQDSGPQIVLGGKLGAAVAAAAAPSASAAAGAKAGADAAGEGPPENGVMGPTAADKAHPPGAPPKVELFEQGAEPRVALAPKLVGGAEQKLTLSLGLRAQMPLSVDVAVAFKVEKPKDDKKKADPKKDAEAAAPAGAGAPLLNVVGKVTGASVSAQSNVPEELAKVVATLKGSQIRFKMAPDGTASEFTQELGKDSDKGIESILKALNESLSIVLAPAPSKPVGAGAYWMVTDRAPSSGAEMLRYRVFRVASAGADGAKLSVELRQYSVETTLSVAGAGQGGGEVKLTIDKFESRGKGEISWGPATFLPPAGEVQGQTQALVVPPGQPNQRAQVQTEVRLKLSSN